jgi:hypothetical protein
MPDDDLRFVQDLGLVRQSTTGGLVIANPIYREVIPSSLASIAIASLPQIQATWIGSDGQLITFFSLEGPHKCLCRPGGRVGFLRGEYIRVGWSNMVT